MTNEIELIALKPKGHQSNYYCNYCRKRTPLKYLYSQDMRLIGIGLDQWLFCSHCGKYYKMGIRGFGQRELNAKVNIKEDKLVT